MRFVVGLVLSFFITFFIDRAFHGILISLSAVNNTLFGRNDGSRAVVPDSSISYFFKLLLGHQSKSVTNISLI